MDIRALSESCLMESHKKCSGCECYCHAPKEESWWWTVGQAFIALALMWFGYRILLSLFDIAYG